MTQETHVYGQQEQHEYNEHEHNLDEGTDKTEMETIRVSPRSGWLKDFDVHAFEADVKRIGSQLVAEQGKEDMLHLEKLCGWSRAVTVVGLALMPFGAPNILAIVLMCIGITTRWALIAHHTCHGAYDQLDETKRYNRFKFGLHTLWRRSNDWLDWMLVEAWNVEHNQLHHYALNEPGGDPDFVESNVAYLRSLAVPKAIKYGVVAFFAVSWKFFYYSPNTFKELQVSKLRRTEAQQQKRNSQSVNQSVNQSVSQSKTQSKENDNADAAQLHEGHEHSSNSSSSPSKGDGWRTRVFTLASVFDSTLPEWLDSASLFQSVMLPYALFSFFFLPLPVLFILGKECFINAVINLILADILSNVYSFVIIVTNHAGEDMYTFRTRCKPLSGEFYLRQIISSADFTTGSDLIDFLQGWLNHQSSHHCFPSLSPLSYQKAQPQIREVCRKHGVPYVQENVFIRLKKTVDIMIGSTSSIVFPPELEGFPSMHNKKIVIDAMVDDDWESVKSKQKLT